MNGRVFGASLKPAWTEEQIKTFLSDTEGDIMVYIINHDKDINEHGELIEKHTHVYMEYSTPRKVTTVSNLLKVEPNFIEVVRNKKGYMRYLTHMDDSDKYRYEPSDVFTNHTIEYDKMVMGNSLTDKDIAEYLQQGKGMELLGLVSASKLRTIQSFMHWDTSNATLQEIRSLNDKMDFIVDTIHKVENFALTFVNGIQQSAETLTSGMNAIAKELQAVRMKSKARVNHNPGIKR